MPNKEFIHKYYSAKMYVQVSHYNMCSEQHRVSGGKCHSTLVSLIAISLDVETAHASARTLFTMNSYSIMKPVPRFNYTWTTPTHCFSFIRTNYFTVILSISPLKVALLQIPDTKVVKLCHLTVLGAFFFLIFHITHFFNVLNKKVKI